MATNQSSNSDVIYILAHFRCVQTGTFGASIYLLFIRHVLSTSMN